MRLNTLSPNIGSKKAPRRLGRGIGSTLGKTSGKGHKGQKARSGGYHKVGFEGGQMPLQRRLPKMGFKSKIKQLWAELTLTQLNKFPSDQQITVASLKERNFIPEVVKNVKIIMTGKLDKPVKSVGIIYSASAKKHAIELGSIIE